MELSELTAYAEEKFHMQEQHKWADFPGFSVLTDPGTGKWVALLMRQWDFDTGQEIQRCDIKCGRQVLSGQTEPYLSLPYRMKGPKWVGVKFDDSTQPDVVYRLFDRAVYAGEQQGYTIVLSSIPVNHADVYHDRELPAAEMQPTDRVGIIPEPIRHMLRIYEYRDGSFAEKCRNFYRQGKWMEKYEDDAPWQGEYRHYFPTYHDLNIRQLRGYFTWRTHIRRGEFLPIATSLAYLYVYELLNGIGTSSPEDALQKMWEFKIGFLDSGIGEPSMYKNLYRWMLDYAILHHVPAALACRYADPSLVQKDTALTILRAPEGYTDEELFSALCLLSGKPLEQSPVVKKDKARGRHLFAAVWRYAQQVGSKDDKDLFTACFGARKTFPWYPLANAVVYWENTARPDTDYVLDACRSYHCRGGIWYEERYDNLYFDRGKIQAFLHETDCMLRKALKTGHYLRRKADEAWATEYVEAVIQAHQGGDRTMEPAKISIDLSHLDQIRRDALLTRDSLLTEAEIQETDRDEQKNPQANARPESGEGTEPVNGMLAGLDETHRQILLALLRGEPVAPYIQGGHLMPSIVADTINEIFFDEIGDNILECDGNTMAIVEDYKEDILQMLGGKSE